MQKQNREALKRIAILRKNQFDNNNLFMELTVTMVYPNIYDCDAGKNPSIPHYWIVRQLEDDKSWGGDTLLMAVEKMEKELGSE